MIEFKVGVTSEIMQRETNRCISQMIDFALEDFELEDKEKFLDLYFPENLCRENPQKCFNILLELKEWTNDLYYHQLTPLHEYALYKICKSYFEIAEMCEKEREEDKENQFKFNFLNVKEYKKEEWISLKILNNKDFYLVDIFTDLDFLSVEEIASSCQRGIPADKILGIDLNNYLELMPYDIRKEISENEKEDRNKTEDEEFIIQQIKNAIIKRERNPERLQKMTEDELSDDIKDLTESMLRQKGIIIERESPGGFAKSKVGENDFFIHKIENGELIQLAIGENKIWNNFEKQVKQLIGYMNENTKFGFTIVFNKKDGLEAVRQKQLEILNKLFKEKETEIVKIRIDEDLISIHKNPENSKLYKIYHLVVNAYHPERKKLAKEARK